MIRLLLVTQGQRSPCWLRSQAQASVWRLRWNQGWCAWGGPCPHSANILRYKSCVAERPHGGVASFIEW